MGDPIYRMSSAEELDQGLDKASHKATLSGVIRSIGISPEISSEMIS